MRVFLWLGVLILLAVGGAWLGGESWIARQVADQMAARSNLRAEAVLPLREPGRLGLELVQPGHEGRLAGLSMPWLRLWLSPLSPTEVRAALPDDLTITQAGRDHALRQVGAAASLKILPFDRASVGRVTIHAGQVSLDGAPLAERLDLAARLVGLGADAPATARSAYEARLEVSGFRARALQPLGLPSSGLSSPVSVNGPLQIWLDAVPDLPMLAGDAPAPRLVGLRSEGIDLLVGGVEARAAGRLWQDADGRAEGRLAIYSRDGDGLLRRAVEAGLIPPNAETLASAMLAGLGRMPFPDDTTGTEMLAAPAEGELRLPLVMREGRLFIGTIEIGPAPLFPSGI